MTSPIPPADEPEGAAADPGARKSATGPLGLGRIAVVLGLLFAGAAVPFLGPSLALDGTGEGTMPGAGAVTLLRTVMFAALAVHTGELFVRLLRRRLPAGEGGVNALPEPRSWSAAASAAGFVAAFGLALIVSTGNLIPQQWADMDLGGLYGTRDGSLALIEVNGFLLAAFCARGRRPAVAALPLGAVVVAEALRAHPEVHSPLFGAALTLAHLTCAALWTGGLLQVLRTLHGRWRTAPAAAAALLGRYARVALVLFGVLTLTGILSTLRRLPLEDVLDTAYGRVLVAKLLLVAAVAVLAVLARGRLHRAADPATALVPARAEVVLLLAAVAVSALLTAVPLPVFYRPAFWWTWF